MVMKIVPYKQGSASAKALSESLGIKRLRAEGSVWKGAKGDVVINWGCSRQDHPAFNSEATILNRPQCVAMAADKRRAFNQFMMNDVNTVRSTTSIREARGWLALGATVIVRQNVSGHSGEGISIVTPEEYEKDVNVLPQAPLYTWYVKKTQEFRAHVFKDNVFFVQRKARKLDVPDEMVNWQVRNHANGFIYAHEGVEISDEAKQQAVLAVGSLGLTFGAVDLMVTKDGRWFVLEVNTACGLEGTTLQKYTEQFNNLR